MGIASANGRAVIVDVGSNYDDATVLDCLPEVPAEVHLGARTNGLPIIYCGANHGDIEPQNSDTSTKLAHIFMPPRAAPLAIDRHASQAWAGRSEALRRPDVPRSRLPPLYFGVARYRYRSRLGSSNAMTATLVVLRRRQQRSVP